MRGNGGHAHGDEGVSFGTVREMVGLIDYATNSAQGDDLSVTY